ncbi:MAG: hypothetical protein GDA46_01735 [Bdellovibrionales bacterium]|nr:hypothetical protein [Bdellovibrionales bacterium]
MKFFLLIVLAYFSFNTLADMTYDNVGNMDMMSDMMANDSANVADNIMAEEDGLVGSFALRYKALGFEEPANPLSYRARLGWRGTVNDLVQWNLVLSTNTEQAFGSIGLRDISFEKAYISYAPVEGLKFKVGKMGWLPDYHKAGVLVSEQLYIEGVNAKYTLHDGNTFGKVSVYRLVTEEGNKQGNDPLSDGITLKGKLGTMFNVSNFDSSIYVMGLYDGLLPEESNNEVNTLAQAGISVTSSEMPVPLGVFAHYMSDIETPGEFSYVAGVSVGHGISSEEGDFGLAVSYHQIDASDYRTSWLNEDYVNNAGSGVSARLQYNVWDQSNLVVKYAYNLDDNEGEPHNVVAELTFLF